MPDLPTIGGGPSETGSTPASTTGITLTANAVAHTKATSFTEIIASTDYAANWLMVELTQSSGSNVGYLVDIAVGASTAEQVLIANLHYHASTNNSPNTRAFLFPLRVPAGTRISGRSQSSAGGGSVRAVVHAISSGISAPPGLGRVETIGANTGTSNGTTIDFGASAHTDVVGELVAASAFAYRWMCLEISNPTDVTWNATTTFLIDVVTGAGGSEVSVIDDLYVAGGTGGDQPSPANFCFPCAIAAGARVAVRGRCSVTTDGDRDIDFIGYGCG
jgi:hypothetical protein